MFCQDQFARCMDEAQLPAHQKRGTNCKNGMFRHVCTCCSDQNLFRKMYFLRSLLYSFEIQYESPALVVSRHDLFEVTTVCAAQFWLELLCGHVGAGLIESSLEKVISSTSTGFQLAVQTPPSRFVSNCRIKSRRSA